jgi:hypothetical protein
VLKGEVGVCMSDSSRLGSSEQHNISSARGIPYIGYVVLPDCRQA